MSSESLNNELNNLERRIKLIISEQAKLKNEVEIYQNENLQLREKISQKERELNSFQNKLIYYVLVILNISIYVFLFYDKLILKKLRF